MTDAQPTPTKGSDAPTVTKYNQTEMKVVCDEALQQYLAGTRGYKQYHTHTDVKLLLGYAACLLAAFDFAYTWKKPFEETKNSTLLCVVAFFILSGLSALYAYLVQKDTVFVGYKVVDGQGIVLSAASQVKRGDQQYYVTFAVRPLSQPAGSNQTAPVHFADSFGKFFYESGQLEPSALASLLEPVLDSVESKKHN
ncbi:hypothetical protein H4R35_005675 [Dimargaris xerosporica]|nr:hypothetical protein H4R35_005675 [Dimargaris xerosporica]